MGEKEHYRIFTPALLLSALVLLIPALYNMYPMVNPDTATYLASGFKPETPFDRPITYGLFLWLFSAGGLSLWLVIFAQAFIVSWLIFLVIRAVLGQHPYRNVLVSMVVVGLLSLTTGLSWLVCQVQPDVFTAVGFLCMVVLLTGKEGRVVTIIVYALFFLSVAMHMSHPLLFAGSALCLFLARRIYGYSSGARTFVALFALSAAAIGVMGAAMSKSKYIFFTGTLLHKGVAQQYLADNCATKNYQLCKYRSELTTDSDHFMWNPESPLYKIGGWQDAKPELTTMINDVLTTPRYQWMYARAVVAQSAKQAVTFHIGGGNEPLDLVSNVGQRIYAYFPKEAAQFANSRQNRQNLHEVFKIPNTIFAAVVCISLLIICYMLTRWRTLAPGLKIMVTVSLTGIILNITDCAAFGILHPRYGAKMIWLLPMCAFLFLTTIFYADNKSKTISSINE